MRFTELFTNADGRLSTTASIQFWGFIAATGVLLYSVYLDKPYVPEMFSTFLFACVGTAATKGVANALSRQRENRRESE
ncbi:hypothetical protein BKK54_04115 [Rodentibacter genomosp. 1]|uniref:DUF2644 domain-containing protein n=1 Tax=Rodentibacter genomosp. 1 TaxID=1908264 RepID=A0A1V3J6K8_9PAST|nr:DUF2644 domain-containing protein [Rodentibacter genomosp. 1]OOF50891.1 hypothetical protein BKK54_04115 [Rodentibacter genomosp. 1]